MTRSRVYTKYIRERKDVTVRAMIPGNDGATLALSRDVDRIEAYVFDLSRPRGTQKPTDPIFIEHVSVEDVMYDTPQTAVDDPGWRGPVPGYNFKWVASARFFQRGDAHFRIELIFSLTRQTAYDVDNSIVIVMDVFTEGMLAFAP